VNCPKCRTEPMRPEVHEGIAVDRCPACRGMWLDKGELHALLERQLGHVADTMAFSAMSDTMDTVEGHCERCDRPMTPALGPGDMRVDHCEACGAVFLDQGELASLQLHGS